MNRNKEHIGFITQFSLDRLVGFLFPLTSESPRVVQLFINNELLAEQIASRESNVLERHQLKSNYQFDFDLRMVQTVYWSDEISVRADGYELAWSHQLLLGLHKNGVVQKHEPDHDLFFFLHVPKTAGTSFRMMLYNQFNQQDIWPNTSDLERNRKRYLPVDELRKMSYEQRQSLHLVMGHFKIAVTREFISKPIIISFWRKPINHMISLASHKQRQMAKLSKMNLVTVIEEHIVDNPQTRFLLPPHTHNHQITDELFQLALRNLELCDFVGVQDRFDEGLNYLEQTYNWSLGRRVKKNVGGKHVNAPDVLHAIKKRTTRDEELYKAAAAKFTNLLDRSENDLQ